MASAPDDLYGTPDLPGEPFPQEGSEEIPLTPEQQGQLEALAQVETEVPPEEEELPEEFMVTDPIQLIPIAIANSRLLQIMYQNRRGDTKLYVIEPYEIGGSNSHPAGYLWGFDRNAGTIKSFFLSNLMDVQLLDEEFIPRAF